MVSSSYCGSIVPCSVYFTKYPFNIEFDVISTWNFQVTVGFNNLLLSQAVNVNKGNFLLLTQSTGKIALDTTGTALYSDLYWSSVTQWTNLSVSSNQRFYLTPLTNFSSYMTSFNIDHTYNSVGLYPVLITFSSSNQTFQQIVNITDCN